jgi:hypothetical protein
VKDLLTAIRDALRAGLSIKPQDVFLTPDEDYLPKACGLPAVGVKDGGTRRSELAAGMIEEVITVRLAVWVRVVDLSEALCGNADAGRPGILDLAASVHEILDENTLGLPGVLSAFSPWEDASRFGAAASADLQNMVITYEYLKQEARP